MNAQDSTLSSRRRLVLVTPGFSETEADWCIPVLRDLAEGLIEVAATDDAPDLAHVQAMELQICHPEVDADLPWVDPVQAHLRHAGDAFQGPDDLAVEQIVALGEVPGGAETPLEDGRIGVAAVPVGADLDVADVVGQFAADAVDALPDLHPRQVHVAGAGSFGAVAKHRPEATPRLYNLVEITPDHGSIKVYTRCMRKDGGVWEPHAIWPGDKPGEPRPYYVIR